MARLTGATVVRHPESGEVVTLAAGDLPAWADGLVGDHLIEAAQGDDVSPYAALTKAELKAEVDKRNADRDDDAKLAPESDKNADLIAALDADDAKASEAEQAD